MMKLLMVPARRSYHLNPLPSFLTQGFESHGCTVDDFSADRILKDRYDAVLFHWPEHFASEPRDHLQAVARSAAMLSAVAWLRARRARVHWLAHDLEPLRPTRPRLTAALMNAFVPQLSTAFCLSRLTERHLVARWPRLSGKTQVIAHGLLGRAYRDEPPAWAGPLEAFRKGRRLFGYLGDIKPYKGPATIARIVAAADPSCAFLIAGKAESAPEVQAALARLADPAWRDRVFIHGERIRDENMGWIARQCAALLLPYEWGWNTGLGHLALEYGLAVIGSRAPAFVGLAEEYPAAPVFTCGTEAEYLAAIAAVKERAAGPAPAPSPEFLARNEWREIAGSMLRAMRPPEAPRA